MSVVARAAIRIFKGLDGLFSCVDPMVVRFNQLQFALLFGEKLFGMFCCLVVHHIQFWFEPF
jgi:hypothetical protein